MNEKYNAESYLLFSSRGFPCLSRNVPSERAAFFWGCALDYARRQLERWGAARAVARLHVYLLERLSVAGVVVSSSTEARGAQVAMG